MHSRLESRMSDFNRVTLVGYSFAHEFKIFFNVEYLLVDLVWKEKRRDNSEARTPFALVTEEGEAK